MSIINDSVINQFTRMVEKYPQNIALCVDSESYSYEQLSWTSRCIAEQLQDKGIVNRDVVGLLANDDWLTYASILAIMSLGAAYVPLNNKNPVHRNEDIINDTNMKFVVSSTDHSPLLDVRQDIEIVTPNTSSSSINLEVRDIELNDLAYILFTSGSTGKPKGVPISHKNLNAFMNVMLSPDSYDLSENDRFLQMFELTFDMSVSSFFMPLSIGASCFVVPQKGISYMNIINVMNQYDITVTQMVPSVISYLQRFFDELEFTSVRYSMFAGEALPITVLPGWQKVIPNAQIVNLYGPTETTIYCYRYDWNDKVPPEDLVNGIVAIGEPWPGIDTCLIDEAGHIVEGIDVRGELCIKGDQTMQGYWENPEKNRSSFVDIGGINKPGRYYRSGDLVFINENGNTIYQGRTDHQVKIDGLRIELGDIEFHVRDFMGTPMVAAVVLEDPRSAKKILTVFIETKKAISEQELNTYLAENLPPYMLPKKVRILETMPTNQNGKIDRKALMQFN